ncbi:MAG: cytochrome c oxidase assembly protein [Rhodospirillaceae bacterium]|nr:cytochrome c oxidase assembly protein [Rhodospirillaceae bacterium]
MKTSDNISKQKNITLVASISLALFMVSVSFAFVPLYNFVCSITGWGGTPNITQLMDVEASNSTMTIRFDANIDPALPWTFKPREKSMEINLGKEYLASYLSTNPTSHITSGISTFNVTPIKAAQYFTKIDCFCFEEQILKPHQTADMPVSFYVDPAILDDKLANDVKTITLSYTFYKSLEDTSLDEDPNSINNNQLNSLETAAY